MGARDPSASPDHGARDPAPSLFHRGTVGGRVGTASSGRHLEGQISRSRGPGYPLILLGPGTRFDSKS